MISVLYNIILITNFKLIEMCIKSSRMERGVGCEVTPIGLLKDGEETLNVWRTYRGISVITPLSIWRGAGGEASNGLRHTDITERFS